MKYVEDSITLGNKTFSAIQTTTDPNVGNLEISENGTYEASNDNLDGYDKVVANVAGGSEEVLISYEVEDVASFFDSQGRKVVTLESLPETLSASDNFKYGLKLIGLQDTYDVLNEELFFVFDGNNLKCLATHNSGTIDATIINKTLTVRYNMMTGISPFTLSLVKHS